MKAVDFDQRAKYSLEPYRESGSKKSFLSAQPGNNYLF